jgi:hypothetical protein
LHRTPVTHERLTWGNEETSTTCPICTPRELLIRGASASVAKLRSRIAIEVEVNDRTRGSSRAGWPSSFDPGTHDLSGQPSPITLESSTSTPRRRSSLAWSLAASQTGPWLLDDAEPQVGDTG